jgi:hypothetical protein
MGSVLQSRLRPLLWIVGVLSLAFVGLQFVRPKLTNPPVTTELHAPRRSKADSEELLLQLPLERDEVAMVR